MLGVIEFRGLCPTLELRGALARLRQPSFRLKFPAKDLVLDCSNACTLRLLQQPAQQTQSIVQELGLGWLKSSAHALPHHVVLPKRKIAANVAVRTQSVFLLSAMQELRGALARLRQPSFRLKFPAKDLVLDCSNACTLRLLQQPAQQTQSIMQELGLRWLKSSAHALPHHVVLPKRRITASGAVRTQRVFLLSAMQG